MTLKAADWRSIVIAGLINVAFEVGGTLAGADAQTMFTPGFWKVVAAGVVSSFAAGVVIYMRGLLAKPAADKWEPGAPERRRERGAEADGAGADDRRGETGAGGVGAAGAGEAAGAARRGGAGG